MKDIIPVNLVNLFDDNNNLSQVNSNNNNNSNSNTSNNNLSQVKNNTSANNNTNLSQVKNNTFPKKLFEPALDGIVTLNILIEEGINRNDFTDIIKIYYKVNGQTESIHFKLKFNFENISPKTNPINLKYHVMILSKFKPTKNFFSLMEF